jgi:hypothetical protein
MTDRPRASLRLDSQGTWHHEGVAFTNTKLASLFNRSIIFRPDTNEYILKIKYDESTFEYDTTPLLALSVHTTATGPEFLLNTERTLPLTADDYFCVQDGDFFLHSSTEGMVRIRRDLYQILTSNLEDPTRMIIQNHSFPIRAS